MPTIKISLAQLNPKTGDLRGNARLILQAMENARQDGADLVVTPELCLTGYCLDEKLLITPAFLEQNRRILMEELLPASTGIAAVVGFIDFDRDRKGPDGHRVRYNAAAVMQDGKLLQVAHKRLLPSYRYFEDKRYFTAGRRIEPAVIQTPCGAVPLGVLICEDLWDEEYEIRPAQLLRQAGAQCLVVLNASPFVASSPGRQDGKRFRRDRMIRQQVEKTGLPIAYLNTVGAGDNGKNLIVFDGMSLAFDAQGRRVLALAPFRPDQQSVVFQDGLAMPVQDPPFDREGEIFEALAMGIRDYCDKIGAFDTVLEPVSGGIDSALGTAIAYQAVGPERLLLYNLPSRFNTPQTRDLAAQLATNFGLRYQVVPIQEMVEAVQRGYEKHLHSVRNRVTLENLQARLRGVLMMMEANDRRALLLSNGNSTEIALGYATLYGDMAGGLAPIGDLTKPDVYRLSRHVNRRWGREMIPQGILDLAPSAELAEAQTDPFEYDLVGPLVRELVEEGKSPCRLADEFAQKSLDPFRYPSDVYERHDQQSFLHLARQLYGILKRSVYKRLQGAPIIAVTERAFGFDLRETLINGWEEE